MKKYSPWFILSLLFLFVFVFLQSTLATETKRYHSHYKPVRLVDDTIFAGCNGAVIGLDGALYVVHTGDGSTSRIDLKTLKVTTFVAANGGVFISDDIAIDDHGNFFITGTTPLVAEVYRVDKNGIKTVIAKDGLLAPNGIRYNFRTGRLFTSECFQANRVFELDPNGVNPPKLLVPANTIAVPEGFDFDPYTDDLIIPDMGTGKILRVHPDTGAISTIAEGFASPIALKVGPDRMIYFPELGGAVYRLSLDGTKSEKLAQLPPGLDNLAITPEGHLYITSYWDATVYKVATDGTGKYATLFPKGPNTIGGIIFKNGKVLISDEIMIRTLEKHKYTPTKLNAWATSGMPLPLGLANGPGDWVFWPDCVDNAVAIGNPSTGEFQAIAGGLNRPMAVLMNENGSKLYIAEYGGGQITELSLSNYSTQVLTAGLEGPLALVIIGNTLYVAEAKVGRISKVDLASSKKEVFMTGLGKLGALADDGAGNLLALDDTSGKLFRIDPKNLKVSIIAEDLPTANVTIGSYPVVEFPYPMTVSPEGDIYIPTAGRGLIMLEKLSFHK
jgi:sugar lactone lactonase YvrE